MNNIDKTIIPKKEYDIKKIILESISWGKYILSKWLYIGIFTFISLSIGFILYNIVSFRENRYNPKFWHRKYRQRNEGLSRRTRIQGRSTKGSERPIEEWSGTLGRMQLANIAGLSRKNNGGLARSW